MRFDELRLIKFGHFEDCVLRFQGDSTADLQIVLGPNEAGKSTTLAAVSNLLFGFPHSTTYDFRFDRQLLRVGAVIRNGEDSFVCHRKKGNVDTLLDDEGRPIDESRLANLLGGQTAESFHRMFSLDHRRLREGGRAILEAKDDIGQAIFAAGVGLVGIASLSDALDEEAKDIWTKRASESRSYYVAHRAYDEARSRLKAAQIKPTHWEDLRKKIDSLDEKIAELRTTRSQRQAELQILERRRRILTPIARLGLAKGALQELGAVANLPSDAGRIVGEATKISTEADAEIRLATQQANAAQKSLSEIAISPALLERREIIEALREEKGAIDKSLLDLPKRRAEQEACQVRVAALLKEIGWAQQPAEAVWSLLPDRPQVAEVRELLEERTKLEAVEDAAKAELNNRTEEVKSLQRLLAALPAPLDASALTAALTLVRSTGDVDVAAEQTEVACQKAVATVERALARLVPWKGDLTQLENLALPAEVETKDLGAALDRAEKELESERVELRKAQQRREALALERLQMLRDEHAVPLEQINTARRKRDSLWGDIRSGLLGQSVLDDPEASADQFQDAMATADAVSDRRFDSAKQSGRLIAVNEQLEQAELAIAQAEEGVRLANAVLERAQAAWRAKTTVVGELSPAAFEAWRDRRERVLEDGAVLGDLDGKRVAALSRKAKVRKALQSALAELGAVAVANLQDVPLAMLVGEAEQFNENTRTEAQRRTNLEAQIETAEKGVRGAKSQLDRTQAKLKAWAARWSPAVSATGLNPATAPVAIRAALDVLDQLRSETDDIMRLKERVDGMDAEITSFEARVKAVGAQCGIERQDCSASEILQQLVASAHEATTLAEREKGLRSQIEDAKRRLRLARAEADRTQSMLQPLFKEAGVTTRSDLEQAVERANAARARRDEIAKLREEIVSLGDGLNLEELLAEGKGAEASALQVEADQLQAQVKDLNEEIENVGEMRARTNVTFRELDDRPDAAVAAADLAQARAEIEFQAEAYVRRRAEATLLRWAIERYRREKQAPLLKRASELFSTLTLRRYVALDVDMESGRPQLMGITADRSSAVPVTRMSDGTIDQLYLALRLAAVEDALAAGLSLPFLADDLFINYDDARAEAGFKMLAALAAKTQVLFFTHHEHLLAIAERAISPAKVRRRRLSLAASSRDEGRASQ